jgi:hypothetical protein
MFSLVEAVSVLSEVAMLSLAFELNAEPYSNKPVKAAMIRVFLVFIGVKI